MGFYEQETTPSLIPEIDKRLMAGSMTLDVPVGQPAPSYMSQFVAGFSRQNEIVSLLSRKDTGVDNGLDPAYNAWEDIKGTEFEPYWESFARVNNRQYGAAMKQQILMERNMTRTLEASGFVGTFGEIVGGLASPITFIPGAGLLKAAKGGWNVVGSAARIGGASAVGTAIQEGILQGTQETRTKVESAEAIGFSFVLGGLLGGGVAGWLNKGEVALAERGFKQLEATFSQPEGVPKGLGADAVATIEYTHGDLSAAGRITSAMVDLVHQVNPGTRSMTNIIPAVQETTQILTETPLYTNMNVRGDSLGPAVETLIRMNVSSMLARAVTKTDAAFKEMKKLGVKMSHNDFEDAVGRAMRRNDADPNPHVERAAAAWRAEVAEPLKRQGIELGLLPADVTPAGALSYFSRMHNQKMLIAQEPDYKARVRPDVETLVQESYKRDVEETNQKVLQLKQDIQELGLEGTSRVDALADIEAAVQRADMEHPEASLLREEVKGLRAESARLKKEGKVNEAETARVKANEMMANGKELLKAYNETVRPLLRSRKNVEQSVGAMAEEAERIRGQLIDLEETQLRSLQRLVARGQKVEKEIGRIDQIDVEGRMVELKEKFEDLGRQFDGAAEATRKIIDKMKADAEQALKDRRLAQYSPEGTFKAVQEMNKVDTEAAFKRNQMIEKLEKVEEQQRTRAARMDAITKKLDETESLDPVEMREAVRVATEELKVEISALTSRRSERMLRLVERLGEASPEKTKAVQGLRQGQIDRVLSRFEEKWKGTGANLDGSREPIFDRVINDIVDEYFEKVSGRNRYGEVSSSAEYAVTITKGPLKSRTAWVKDETVEPYLENNARMVMERYVRVMLAEIELTKRLGSANLEDIVGENGTIKANAKKITDQIDAATDVAQIKRITGKNFGKDLTLAKEKARTFVDGQLNEGLSDINSLRDILRRSYKAEAQSSDWGRIVKAGNMVNYIRLSGGFGITSINDMFMPAFRHGLTPFIGESVVPLLRGLEGAKLSVAEAKLAGLVVERVNQHRMMALMEINDRFANHTPMERLLSSMSSLASKFNGLQYTQDVGEAISSVLSQNRIINSVKDGKNGSLLAYLGMEPHMEARLAKQMVDFAELKDNVWVANTAKWQDEDAVRLYRAMVSKDVTTTVVRPGIADKPLFGHTPTGQAILQFLSFQLAANQRIMMRGMQESPSRFISGLVALSGLGMGIAYLKSVAGGKETHEKFMKNAENPGWLISEGLDASGLLTLPFMISNDIEKITKAMGNPFNPIKTPLRAVGGEPSEDASLYNQTLLRSFAGPTLSLPDDVAKAGGSVIDWMRGKEVSQAQMKRLQYMIPFGTFIGMRDALQALRGDHVMQR